MKDDTKTVIGIIVGIIGVLMAMGKRTISVVEWGTGWVWPVPTWNAPDGAVYPAVVSQELHPGHAGVDVMYRRRTISDRSEFPPGPAGHATTMFFAPPGTPILAAKDARVWSVSKVATGWQIVLDHGKPWATYYAHLDEVAFPPHAAGFKTGTKEVTNIKAGDQLGTMGWNPNTATKNGAVDAEQIRHLHFECWYKGGNSGYAQDPAPVMNSWERHTW